MDRRSGFGVLAVLLALAAFAGVAYYSYNLGVAQGVVEAGRAVAVPGQTAPVIAIWPRPWGFGFGFFPFFPFLFILFWLLVARRLLWRGAWRMHGCGGVPPGLDEWHRRAHAQQNPPPASESHA